MPEMGGKKLPRTNHLPDESEYLPGSHEQGRELAVMESGRKNDTLAVRGVFSNCDSPHAIILRYVLLCQEKFIAMSPATKAA
jgi:hypothetical protein